MPLQNRVTPFGDIVAHEARGTLMGNRGGRIHDPATRTLTRRRWTSPRWIACLTEFKGRRRTVMGAGYTELFFLDEVTALAAGHRPCFECRRQAAQEFFARLDPPRTTGDFDRMVHCERLTESGEKRIFMATLNDLPEGTMIAVDGRAFAVKGDHLLEWAPGGYVRALSPSGNGEAAVLTPRSVVGILSRGYRPAWHWSAGRLTGDKHQ